MKNQNWIEFSKLKGFAFYLSFSAACKPFISPWAYFKSFLILCRRIYNQNK